MTSTFYDVIDFFIYRACGKVVHRSTFARAKHVTVTSSLGITVILPILFLLARAFSFHDFLLKDIVSFFLAFFVLAVFHIFLVANCAFVVDDVASHDGSGLLIFKRRGSSPTFLGSSFLHRGSSCRIRNFLHFKPEVSVHVKVCGICFMSSRTRFGHLIGHCGVGTVLFASCGIMGRRDRHLIHFYRGGGVHVLLLPSVSRLRKNGVRLHTLPRIHVRSLLKHRRVHVGVRRVTNSLGNGIILIAKTTNSVNDRLYHRLYRFKLGRLILFSDTRAPVRGVQLRLRRGFPSIRFAPIVKSVHVVRHIRDVCRHFHPRVIFRTTTCGRIPLVRRGPYRTIRAGICNAHGMTSVTIGCSMSGFVVISASGTIGPAGIVKTSGHLTRVCIRDLDVTVDGNQRSNGAHFVAAHFKGILNDGNSIVPHFHRRLTGNNPLAIARPSVVHCFVAVPRTYHLILRTTFVNGKGRVFIFSVKAPIGVTSLTHHVVRLTNLVPNRSVRVGCANLHPNRGLCRRLLTAGRGALPARGRGVCHTRIQRCSCRSVYALVSPLVSLTVGMSGVKAIQVVGKVIPRFGDGGSMCRTLSGTRWCPTPIFYDVVHPLFSQELLHQ